MMILGNYGKNNVLGIPNILDRKIILLPNSYQAGQPVCGGGGKLICCLNRLSAYVCGGSRTR